MRHFTVLANATLLLCITQQSMADETLADCKIVNKNQSVEQVQTTPCHFSQRQGYVRIAFPDGQEYSISPVDDQSDKNKDQDNQPVVRQVSKDKSGLIFKMVDKTIYVYWKIDNNDWAQYKDANAIMTATTMSKPLDINNVDITITNNLFVFKGTAQRQFNDIFIAGNPSVLLLLDNKTGAVKILDKTNNRLIFDYAITPIPTFENPDTMCDPANEPC